VLKNRLINGAMVIDQRNNGASLSIGSNSQVYTVDRFTVFPISSGCTAQRVAGISGFQYALKVTGAAGNSQIQIGQKIESANTYDLINQNITISFYAQASSNVTQQLLLLYPNSTDSWGGGYTQIGSANFNITTTAQFFSVTFNAGANAANGLGILFANAAYGAGASLTLTGVQLEIGTSATPFERRLYNQELANCQRYYYQQGGAGLFQIYSQGGLCASTTGTYLPLQMPVTMRAIPTLTYSTVQVQNATGGAVSATLAIGPYPSPQNAFLSATVASGLVAGNSTFLGANNSLSSYVGLSAEL
jgi:hypothetical protein